LKNKKIGGALFALLLLSSLKQRVELTEIVETAIKAILTSIMGVSERGESAVPSACDAPS